MLNFATLPVLAMLLAATSVKALDMCNIPRGSNVPFLHDKAFDNAAYAPNKCYLEIESIKWHYDADSGQTTNYAWLIDKGGKEIASLVGPGRGDSIKSSLPHPLTFLNYDPRWDDHDLFFTFSYNGVCYTTNAQYASCPKFSKMVSDQWTWIDGCTTSLPNSANNINCIRASFDC